MNWFWIHIWIYFEVEWDCGYSFFSFFFSYMVIHLLPHDLFNNTSFHWGSWFMSKEDLWMAAPLFTGNKGIWSTGQTVKMWTSCCFFHWKATTKEETNNYSHRHAQTNPCQSLSCGGDPQRNQPGKVNHAAGNSRKAYIVRIAYEIFRTIEAAFLGCSSLYFVLQYHKNEQEISPRVRKHLWFAFQGFC